MKMRRGQTQQLLEKLLQKKKGIRQLPFFMIRTKSDGQCILMKHCVRHQGKKIPKLSKNKIMTYCNRLPGATEKSIPLEHSETVQAKPKMT